MAKPDTSDTDTDTNATATANGNAAASSTASNNEGFITRAFNYGKALLKTSAGQEENLSSPDSMPTLAPEKLLRKERAPEQTPAATLMAQTPDQLKKPEQQKTQGPQNGLTIEDQFELAAQGREKTERKAAIDALGAKEALVREHHNYNAALEANLGEPAAHKAPHPMEHLLKDAGPLVSLGPALATNFNDIQAQQVGGGKAQSAPAKAAPMTRAMPGNTA